MCAHIQMRPKNHTLTWDLILAVPYHGNTWLCLLRETLHRIAPRLHLHLLHWLWVYCCIVYTVGSFSIWINRYTWWSVAVKTYHTLHEETFFFFFFTAIAFSCSSMDVWIQGRHYECNMLLTVLCQIWVFFPWETETDMKKICCGKKTQWIVMAAFMAAIPKCHRDLCGEMQMLLTNFT